MEPFSFGPLQVGERRLRFDEPVVMGVVNVTPNSFSTGHSVDAAASIAHGVQLWREGAAILDVGGEATNPKAAPISAEEEWLRVEPVLRGLAAATGAILSIDTTKAEVAARAVAAGATLINDVSGGRFDAAMIDTVADLVRSHRVAYVASHLRGRSISEVFAAEGQGELTKEAVVAELVAQVAALPAPVRAACLVDPGLGFGKGAGSLNLELLRAGAELVRATGRPVLIGPSRKRFLRRLLPPHQAAPSSEPSLESLDGASTSTASPSSMAVGEPSSPDAAGAASHLPPGAAPEPTRGASSHPSPGPSSSPATGALPDHAAVLELDLATVGACLAAVQGGAQVLRIHAVALLRPALAVYIKK